MRRPLQSDSATQHRAAAAFALAFASATITTLAGVLALNLTALRVAPAFALDMLPDSTWAARWLPGAVSAAQQQQAAAEQWLHVILVFATLTVAIACSNALIGLLSHANERRYESAVRGIVGASQRQLRRTLRRNAFVNAGAGVIAGVPVGMITAFLIRSTWQFRAGTTTQTWALLALCVTLLVAMLAAQVSARRFARPGWLGDALAPAARSVPGWGAEDLRALLTAAQLACAVALTTVSLLAWASALPASAARRPTDRAHSWVSVARVTLPARLTAAERRGAYDQITHVMSRQRGVEAESIASPGVLLGMGKIDKVISECGRCARAKMFTPIFAVETQQHVVGNGFFQTAGIRLERGREFTDKDDDARSVVVNDTFARLAFQGQNPIGKRIMVGGFGGDWFRVIGVVPDIPVVGLRYFEADPLVSGPAETAKTPAVYFSTLAFAPATIDVVIRTETQTVTLAGFDFEPLTRILARAVAPQKSFARVITLIGLLLCGAAAIGTFMTTMLNVKARRSEIAIRRALGARRRDIWRLIYGSLARVVARGVLTGLIVSVALSRVLEVFVPGLPAFDARTAAIVSTAFGLIACAAALLPMREALQISPAQGTES